MKPDDLANLLSSTKRIMKTKGMTYADLAKDLSVSEATIKRFFTSEDASFLRLQEICDILGVSLANLILLNEKQNEATFSLTIDQEKFFAENLNYFGVFQVLLELKLSPTQLRSKFSLTQRSLIKYLRKLDDMNLIEWSSEERIRWKVKGTLNWLPNGPLQNRLTEEGNSSFLNALRSKISNEDQLLTISDRALHPDTYAAYLAELKSLAATYRKKAYRDETHFAPEELVPCKWLIALGPYQYDFGRWIKNL